MAVLTVNIVSAESEVWSGEAEMLIAQTLEGEIGILAGHVPLLAVLAKGDIKVKLAGGKMVHATAEDGFISVEHDVVTVVAGTATLNE